MIIRVKRSGASRFCKYKPTGFQLRAKRTKPTFAGFILATTLVAGHFYKSGMLPKRSLYTYILKNWRSLPQSILILATAK
ncbi:MULTISPECIES: hypothetical protein [Cyanophyceae]|uniref:hypothetical protein n=1 Tax=Cyanophyceae TaxID=3028117 RepID=UPI001684DCAB|nr:hypothetical protein [Trichocoleus sp. FACHB-40]MBD2006269.1 hypothetical protein [Trichocoleus sp. FACHB-40]